MHTVEVLLEDLLLGQMGLEPQRPQRLRHLALPIAIRRMQQTRKLHRDGRCPGHDARVCDVVAKGTAQRAHVDAVVVPEAPVLHSDERVDQVGIELAIRLPLRAAPVGRARGSQRDAVSVLDRDRGQLIAIEETVGQGQHDPQEHTGNCERSRHSERSEESAFPVGRQQMLRFAQHDCEMLLHCCFATTVNVPPSLRPRTPGLYISSACAGGLMKVPGVVARAT